MIFKYTDTRPMNKTSLFEFKMYSYRIMIGREAMLMYCRSFGRQLFFRPIRICQHFIVKHIKVIRHKHMVDAAVCLEVCLEVVHRAGRSKADCKVDYSSGTMFSAYLRHLSMSACMSSGSFESSRIISFVRGCTKPKVFAWRA